MMLKMQSAFHVSVLVLAVLVLAAAASACGSGATSGTATTSPARTSSTTPPPTTVPPTTVPPTTVPPTTTTTTDPGLLPQTSDEPPVATGLQAALTPLWTAITRGDPAPGLAAFFPRSAYLQMKTGVLANPSSDYTGRLIAFYELDVPAYHQALGADAASALLESVAADPALAQWIAPGTCENKMGYWHLPGVRLVYRSASGVHSFAVASLISWRGTWYVVHLGPNPRPSNVGTVAQPADGPGTPGPGGGC
ncbi:MAG: hypothetical protein WCI26_04425 [Acidimicrobiales bacterium]